MRTIGDVADSEQHPARRGRVAKREAILAAALRVFVQDGYAAAGIDRIAALAGVAKPTVYNHFGDKEALFRSVMLDSARRSAAKIIEALDARLGGRNAPTDDLAERLTDVAHVILECQLSDEGWALQRLLYAEASRMPDLYDEVARVGGQPVVNALAGWLARLAHRGELDVDAPETAASQFMTLIAGDLPALSALGTRPISQADLTAAVAAGVGTFLRAFAPGVDRPKQTSRAVSPTPRREGSR